MNVSLRAAFSKKKPTGNSSARRKPEVGPQSDHNPCTKRRKRASNGAGDGSQSTDRNSSAVEEDEDQATSGRRGSESHSSDRLSDPSSAEVTRVAGRGYEGAVLSKDVSMLKEIILDSQRQLTSTVQRLAVSTNDVTESLSKKLSDLERIVMKNSENTTALLYLLSQKDKKKKTSEKDKKMDVELLILDVLFGDDIIERVMEYCTIRTFEKFLDKVNSQQVPVQASSAFRTIMFAKPVGSPISLFSSGIGQQHSIYRKSIVVTLIDSVRKNTFSQFEPKDSQKDELDSEKKDSDELKPKCPRWLHSGFILDKHIEQVKNSKEVTQSETSGTRKQKQVQLSRNEIACKAVERIFKLVINRIKVGRESGKNAFFLEVGYLFVVWSQILSANTAREVNQESVDLQWYTEKKSDTDIDLDELCSTKYVPRNDLSYSCADENPSDYNVNNVKLFSDLIEDNPDMVLQVSHDVVVKKNKNGKITMEKKRLTRYINLLDVAARVLSNFIGVRNPSSPMSVLSAAPSSMKCLYALALLFRGLIDGIMSGIGQYASDVLYRSEENGDDNLGVYRPVYHQSLTIADLVPSRTKKLRSMTKCVCLTEGEFRSMNESTNAVNHSNDEEDEEDDEEEEDDEY